MRCRSELLVRRHQPTECLGWLAAGWFKSSDAASSIGGRNPLKHVSQVRGSPLIIHWHPNSQGGRCFYNGVGSKGVGSGDGRLQRSFCATTTFSQMCARVRLGYQKIKERYFCRSPIYPCFSPDLAPSNPRTPGGGISSAMRPNSATMFD